MRTDWLVVGAGPCGIFAVASLLRRGAKVTWIDPSFSTGRLSRYGSVPANTRNDRLCRAFQSLPHLQFAPRQASRAGPSLARTDPGSTASLQLSIDALRDGSEALQSHEAVRAVQGSVHLLAGDGDGWRAETCPSGELRSRNVLLCTGAAPRLPSPALTARLAAAGIPVLDHDTVVTPAAFEADGLARRLRGSRLAVVGGSHSGLLAARNAVRLAGCERVDVYGRGAAVKFAEERPDYIKYDGTGLKGEVAAWAREALDQGLVRYCRVPARVPGDEALAAALVASAPAAVAFTAGFDRALRDGGGPALPAASWEGQPLDLAAAEHCGRTGRIARGLHGGGIAFPEVWTDPEGHTEPRVGFVRSYVAHLERIFDAAESEAADHVAREPEACAVLI